MKILKNIKNGNEREKRAYTTRYQILLKKQLQLRQFDNYNGQADGPTEQSNSPVVYVKAPDFIKLRPQCSEERIAISKNGAG